jgi:hypothetical protein
MFTACRISETLSSGMKFAKKPPPPYACAGIKDEPAVGRVRSNATPGVEATVEPGRRFFGAAPIRL